jgi:hypothetical protein
MDRQSAGANAKPELPMKTSPIIKSHWVVTLTLTLKQAKELVDGKWYFTLHTILKPRGEIRDHQATITPKWSIKLVTRLIILIVSHFIYRRNGGSWQNNVSVRSTVSQLLLRALYCPILLVKWVSFNLWPSTEAGRVRRRYLTLDGVDNYHVFARG